MEMFPSGGFVMMLLILSIFEPLVYMIVISQPVAKQFNDFHCSTFKKQNRKVLLSRMIHFYSQQHPSSSS